MLRFAKKTPQDEFWRWFLKHEDVLYNFERDRDHAFKLIEEALHRVQKNLTFEFSSELDSKRDFIISANGIKESFPAVVALTQAAPPLPRWNLIAFRPRRGIGNELKYGGKKIHSNDIQFTLVENGNVAGIYLFLPGHQSGDNASETIGFLMLDNALGEFDVETRLGRITFYAPEAVTEGNRYPLRELPELFDELIARLEGRSGKPS
jgi:hypothetical protein